jgi:DNA-binding CsgD family transcriptional regulator
VTGSPPRIVVEGPEGAGAPDLRRLREEGNRLRPGFAASIPATGRVVCHGRVTTDADAAAVVLAALAGYGLMVEVPAGGDVVMRLVDDLRHLGPVVHRVAEPAHRPVLHAQGRALLKLLAEGVTLGEASAQVGIARRTADRRLSAVRRELGATRTTEAIALARRAGLLD